MKSPRNDDHVLVVGIFQHPEIARAALKNLRRARFRRAAAVHGSATHRPRVEECDIWAIGWAASVVALLAIGIFIFWQRGTPADFRPAGLATLLGVFVAFGALVGWTSYRLLRQHVDDAQLTDLRRSLPGRAYGELPLITRGSHTGLPRVYHLASELVAGSGGALDTETIQKFLVAFQTNAQLDIGELWAVPLMLRLRLLEC